jgi:hypothetical protein
MMEKLPADVSVIDRLTGTYKKDDGKTEEFYKKDGMLWIKSAESINGGYPLEYAGDNTFKDYGWETTFKFTIEKDGSIKLAYNTLTWDKKREGWEAVKGK